MHADGRVFIHRTHQILVHFFGQVRHERCQQLGNRYQTVDAACYTPIICRYRSHSSRNGGGCGVHTSWKACPQIPQSSGPRRWDYNFPARNPHQLSVGSAPTISTRSSSGVSLTVFGRVRFVVINVGVHHERRNRHSTALSLRAGDIRHHLCVKPPYAAGRCGSKAIPAQSVRTVQFDHIHRFNDVAAALAHPFALGIQHQFQAKYSSIAVVVKQ